MQSLSRVHKKKKTERERR
jgi:hypothetical protein